MSEANKNSYISINRTQILVFWQPHVDLQSVNLSFWQRNSCEYACCLCFKICVKDNFINRQTLPAFLNVYCVNNIFINRQTLLSVYYVKYALIAEQTLSSQIYMLCNFCLRDLAF